MTPLPARHANLRIDLDRLMDRIMELGRVGALEGGGVCRLALTDVDKQGRDLFVRWCEDAGCSVSYDAMGNIFARRPGRDNSLPPIMTGSHLDSQPTGGKFDGAYGVLAGLEVIRTLNDLDYQTEAPLEVVAWTNEEGSRFAPAMVGSGVFAQVFDLDYGLSRADQDGNTLGQELQRIGYAGPEQPGQHPVGAYFEAHIEQGPILEAAGKTIGVVQGAQGQRWYEVTVTGQEAHAGPTPMLVRRDALVGAARMVEAVNRIGLEHQPNACATCGMLNVMPNSRNVIPGQVWFTVDFRHPDDAILAAMDQALRQELAQIAEAARLELALEQIWHSPATPFDESCVAAVRKGTEQAGYAHMDIISGAGHDAVYMAKIAPAAMIFVPCENGISHNEIENATPQDIAAGCNVLLHAMLEKANEKAHTSE